MHLTIKRRVRAVHLTLLIAKQKVFCASPKLVSKKALMTENNQDSRSVDVFGVGNALVDILALVED